MAIRPKESVYYPAVQGFLKRLGYICESVGRNRKPIPFIMKGIGQIIVDVFGIKSTPSPHSTAIEVAAVEVKRRTSRAPLRDMNQAFNNSKIANFCYLAMPHAYTDKELATAAELGIGLLEIGRGNRIRMVAQSRRFQPSQALLREFFRKNLNIAQCSICQNFRSLYDIPKGSHREGGGWRKNVFALRSKWTYFCPQCRERFENAFTERHLGNLFKKVAAAEQKQKQLREQLRKYRKLAKRRGRVRR
jgi:hypothetical protein